MPEFSHNGEKSHAILGRGVQGACRLPLAGRSQCCTTNPYLWVYGNMGSVKTTIELPDELFIAAKKRAAETRVTLKEIFERSLRRELYSAATPKRSKRRPIRWVTAKGGVPPGMDVANREHLYQWLQEPK